MIVGCIVAITALAGVDLEVAPVSRDAAAPIAPGSSVSASTPSSAAPTAAGSSVSATPRDAAAPTAAGSSVSASTSSSPARSTTTDAVDPADEGAASEPASKRRRRGRAGERARDDALAVSRVEVPVAVQTASGYSSERRWLVALQGGYPWWGARAQLGAPKGFSPLVDLQMARFRRFRPAIGVTRMWVDRAHLKISGELLAGWLFQIGDLARRGPNLELRLRLAVPLRRAVPYVMLGSQHTLLADRTTVDGVAGTTRTWSYRGEWTGFATIGVMVAIAHNLGLDFGLDAAWVDAGAGTPAIPGAHFGFAFGGAR